MLAVLLPALLGGLAEAVPVETVGGAVDGEVGEPEGGVVGDGLLPDFKQLLSLLGWTVTACE